MRTETCAICPSRAPVVRDPLLDVPHDRIKACSSCAARRAALRQTYESGGSLRPVTNEHQVPR